MNKKTALFDKHISLGAKMVPFAGFEMPVQYTGVTDEHFAVREKVGIFDVSHMGQFFVEGASAKDLLQFITTNNINTLENGKAQYTCLPNGNGGIVDDLIIYKMNDEKYFVVVNASNIDKDWNHFTKYNEKFGAKLTNVSDEMSLIAIQGPKATETLQKLTETNLSKIPYYHFTEGSVAGISDVIISNTGYTGSGGFEIYFKNENAIKIWEAITGAGKDFGLIPCGLASRDTLRLEKGFCLYGNDIDDTTSPIEAGLGWITKFDKEFVDKETFAKQKEEGVNRKLIGFEMQERAIPRHDYLVVDTEGNAIGKVTSGTMSPIKNIGIGLAYVAKPYFKLGSEIFIQIRNKNILAKVVKLPFV
jgi:aminomethyltransferase